MTYNEFDKWFRDWFNSAHLDVSVCGALGGRMGLRLVPLFAGKVELAQDNTAASTYMELVAAAFSVLVVVRARSKYPQSSLLDLARATEEWLGKSVSAFNKPNADGRSAAGLAAATAAVTRAEADKGAPLTPRERMQVYGNANLNGSIEFDPAETSVSSAALALGMSVGVFTSHRVGARDLPHYATLAFSAACRPGGPLGGMRYLDAYEGFMAAIVADVEVLKSGANVGDFSDLPLWPRGEPEWATACWRKLRAGLASMGGWNIWSTWYEERLVGPGYSSELFFSRNPKATWSKGPEAWAAFWSQSVTALADVPVAPSEEQQTAGTARTALLIRRSDLPAALDHQASSFIGGLPTLPRGLEWPRAVVDLDGEKKAVALTFFAQINLADLPHLEEKMPLPKCGALFFFCSSSFEDGSPPVRVLFDPKGEPAPSHAEPPADLMLLGGPGSLSAGWLAAENGAHARVQFKYPVTFHAFKDYAFDKQEVAKTLKIASLCEILGDGEPRSSELWHHRDHKKLAADEDWPFNWSLIAHVLYSVCVALDDALLHRSYGPRLSDAGRRALQGFLGDARAWRQRALDQAPFASPDHATKQDFRSWWQTVAAKITELNLVNNLSSDVSNAIEHNVNLLAEGGLNPVQYIPIKCVETVTKRNVWTDPREGKFDFSLMPIHQMLGYGACVQHTPITRRNEVLLLQLCGDQALFPWHDNCGCVLQVWIKKDALRKRDFSKVEATVDCD
jgi:hypothetical protein